MSLYSTTDKEREKMKDKIKGNNYIYWGITLFSVIAASILLFFTFLKFDIILRLFLKIFVALEPILLGLLFAYLLSPLVKVIDRHVSCHVVEFLAKKCKEKIKNKKKVSRIFSIFLTYLVTFLMIVLFVKFVIPSLFDSLNMMLTNIPVYLNNIYDSLKDLVKNNPELEKLIDQWNTDIVQAVRSIVLPSMDMIIANITVGISSILKWTINILIGLIVSVYLIYDKDSFIDGAKKVLRALLPRRIYDTTMTTLGYTDKIFGGFMVAKIIDSLIIGVLTFVIISIFRIPYALIISVIVGITNIIPYFGPFIGAIPCIGLLLVIDPAKSLTFAILIFLIQQFDGNILGPKLIGNRTGIKSFWVLFSILLFGSLFGFVGMIFGVPVFAIIYSVFANLINKRLAKREAR